MLSAALVPSVKGHRGDNNSEEERTAECVAGKERTGLGHCADVDGGAGSGRARLSEAVSARRPAHPRRTLAGAAALRDVHSHSPNPIPALS